MSFPLLYFSLEIPKIIINEALSGDFRRFVVLGIRLTPSQFLIALCIVLLTLIVINGLLKMRINTLKGIVGERLIRRLRYQLIQRILRFPNSHFEKTSQGEFISSITAEAEPLAGYISESIALPVFQGGTMITILVFMFAQDWVFGIASVALIPVQGYIIPKLQAQVNALKKERVLRVRKLSERVGETISGAQEIRLQGTQRYVLSEFSHWLGGLFSIRLQIFRKKFFMKFLNNTIGQITPFTFYLFGGLLVIRGDLTIGALVASLAAYKDLTSPWRELLNHYQLHEDARVKYAQILEQFSPPGMLREPAQDNQHADSTCGAILADDVSCTSDTGEDILVDIDFRIAPGTRVAIIGENAVQRMRFARVLSGLESPARGEIRIGNQRLADIDPQWLRTRMACQGPDPFLFAGTIEQNIVYGLYHSPPDKQAGPDARAEAEASGNSLDVHDGDWIDYQRIGIADRQEFEKHYLRGALAVGSEALMYQRGLAETPDPDKSPGFAARVVAARHVIRDKIADKALQRVVGEFDPEIYNPNATVEENILFGIPDRTQLTTAALAAHPYLSQTLSEVGILEEALRIGLKITVRVARDAGRGRKAQRYFKQFGIESVTELANTGDIDAGTRLTELEEQTRHRLLNLFLRLTPSVHTMVLLDSRMENALLDARQVFYTQIPEDLKQAIKLFDRNEIHPMLSIHDNLLFGRLMSNEPVTEARVHRIINETVDSMSLKRAIMLQMTQSQVGVGGQRLPATARHGIAVSRMLIKRPEVMIFHDALAPFSAHERESIRRNILDLLPDSTMLWIDRDVPDKAEFDTVYRLTEQGGLHEVKSVSQDGAASGGGELLTIIGRSMICGRLGASHQQLIADHSRKVDFGVGDFIYLGGDAARHAYIIVSGEARSYRDPDNPESVASVLGEGETFGMMELISDRDCILSVRAETDLTLVELNGDTIRDFIENDVRVVQVMLRALTEQWAGAGRGRRVY